MKTEEEARKLRCCGPYPCGVPDDSSGKNSVQRLCCASDCMAWNRTGLQVVDAAGNLTAEVVEYFEGYAADCYEPRGDCGIKRRTD